MDPNSGRDRGNLNYMSFGITMSDSGDLYSNPNAVALTRPPSGGLGGQVMNRNSLMNTNSQCGGNLATNNNRGIKRTSSDCYDDRGGGMNQQGMNTMDNCGPGNVQDVVDDSYTQIQKKSPPANGKKTKGRVKIKMEYIDNKLRRYTTFSKRKTGIMKKAYELSTLTGTQVMLLVASETGHVYTFATRKLQPMITSEAGKQLIQTCLNSPDPPTGATTGDQRMSATGFEETELSYNIADEESNKDDRSPLSSGDSEDESDDDSQVIPIQTSNKNGRTEPPELQQIAKNMDTETWLNRFNGAIVPQATISKMPSNIFGQLLQSGHLQIHQDQDGTRQYIRFPLVMSPPKISTLTASSSTASTSSAVSDSIGNATITDLSTTNKNGRESTNSTYNDIIIKEEFNE